jgi:hypothetical protein
MVHLLFRLNEIRDSKVVHLNFLSHELENFIKRDCDDIVSFLDFFDLKLVYLFVCLKFDYNSIGQTFHTQFHLFNRENLNSYFQKLSSEASRFISLNEWFLKYNEKFMDKKGFEIFYKQLFLMINICYHQMSSVYNIDFVHQFTQHLLHFYSFMTKFIQHVSSAFVFLFLFYDFPLS